MSDHLGRSVLRPTDEEIARVKAWENAERQEARALREQVQARNRVRVSGYFVGKRITAVGIGSVGSGSYDEVWGLSLAFDDGSSVEFSVHESHIELERWEGATP